MLLIAAIALAGCSVAPVKTTDSPRIVKRSGVSELTPQEAMPGVESAYSQFIDVRSKEEFEDGHAYRARNIPFENLMQNLDQIEKNEPVYLICNTGATSAAAAKMLVDAGFEQAINIKGGMVAWRSADLPMGK